MFTAFKAILIILFIILFVLNLFLFIFRFRRTKHSVGSTILTAVISLVIYAVAFAVLRNHSEVKYYDKYANEYEYATDIIFTDRHNNTYSFNFDKTGYDYLYINNTDARLNADLCYLDQDGFVVYDEDMSITVKDEYSCTDTDGSLYYPVQYSSFSENGEIIYHYLSSNYKYDMLKNAYTYNYVPYYDTENNKYAYHFDSDLMKGFYTNLSDGTEYENEYSFVDENGYFVYDAEHNFVQREDGNGKNVYFDNNGEKYYWASSVYWDEHGNLLLA